jgi:predicted tellurium resistance membrane protein TerC
MWTDSPLLRDAGAAVLTGVAAAVVLRFWEEVANRALLDQVTPLLLSSSLLLLLLPLALLVGRLTFVWSLHENSSCAQIR